MLSEKKIIVLTPVKNEAWILDRFLSVCSQFADTIIIADQNSVDGSKDIYSKYEKVIVIENSFKEFNESSRQLLLIKKAREVETGPKILLGLDADEILAANAIYTEGWKIMLKAKPGTVLYFEKPDLIYNPYQCIRYHNNPFPLGYVDDGIEHIPSKVHSVRIPNPPQAPRLIIDDVKVMHYALTRPITQKAKFRFYSVVENTLGTSNLWNRRRRYNPAQNWENMGKPEPTPSEWFKGWEDKNIDVSTVTDKNYSWYDEEILNYFNRYGSKKYWTESIWDVDWNLVKNHIEKSDRQTFPREIKSPPLWLRLGLKFGESLYHFLKKIFRNVAI